ncbi:MAG: CHAP domain-containing protein [Acidimicrobiales bacterium]
MTRRADSLGRGERAAAARHRRAQAFALRRRRLVAVLAAIVVVVVACVAIFAGGGGPSLTPLEARIVELATSQLGYRTDPPDTYCNRFSAYWSAGALDCPNSNRDEEWCADFAAWVWRKAGVSFVYGQVPGDINAASVSFYLWGVVHHSWHAVGSGYAPQPGDIAVYGLDLATMQAQHVAVVTSYTPGARGPNVVNGDGERTGFSVVETGTDQYKADLSGDGDQLAGYVSPPPPPLLSKH